MESPHLRQVRTLRKKVRQVETLAADAAAGKALDLAQRQKVAGLGALRAELAALERGEGSSSSGGGPPARVAARAVVAEGGRGGAPVPPVLPPARAPAIAPVANATKSGAPASGADAWPQHDAVWETDIRPAQDDYAAWGLSAPPVGVPPPRRTPAGGEPAGGSEPATATAADVAAAPVAEAVAGGAAAAPAEARGVSAAAAVPTTPPAADVPTKAAAPPVKAAAQVSQVSARSADVSAHSAEVSGKTESEWAEVSKKKKGKLPMVETDAEWKTLPDDPFAAGDIKPVQPKCHTRF